MPIMLLSLSVILISALAKRHIMRNFKWTVEWETALFFETLYYVKETGRVICCIKNEKYLLDKTRFTLSA